MCELSSPFLSHPIDRKERFFVVRGDHRIEYYADQKNFEAGAKPKGTIALAGYTIVKDPNGRKMAAKRDLNARFNIDAEVEEYTKYEPLTIECFHPTRRRWLIKCTDEDQFASWSTMFEVCAQRNSARTLTDPLKIAAFGAAFAAARLPLNVPISQARCTEGGKYLWTTASLTTLPHFSSTLKGLWRQRDRHAERRSLRARRPDLHDRAV